MDLSIEIVNYDLYGFTIFIQVKLKNVNKILFSVKFKLNRRRYNSKFVLLDKTFFKIMSMRSTGGR